MLIYSSAHWNFPSLPILPVQVWYTNCIANFSKTPMWLNTTIIFISLGFYLSESWSGYNGDSLSLLHNVRNTQSLGLKSPAGVFMHISRGWWWLTLRFSGVSQLKHFMWLLHITWASSLHGDCIPKGNILRESTNWKFFMTWTWKSQSITSAIFHWLGNHRSPLRLTCITLLPVDCIKCLPQRNSVDKSLLFF